jgi:hypothetical protein
MKANPQTAPHSKAQIVKGIKTASRKATSTVKRSTRSARKGVAETQSALSGYSDSAARFIKRSKAAFGDAYTWAGETGSALPKTVRGLGIPNQKSMQNFIGEKPFVLGAVGLGIGVVLGAMLPSIDYSPKTAPKSTRRK